MGARESRSSATAATSRSRLRAPFKVGSSTLSSLAEHRALEGKLQALENGWHEAEEIVAIAYSLTCRHASKNCSCITVVNSRGSDQEPSECRIGWYLRSPWRNQADFSLSAQRFC
jgi:hypothetical protein